MAAPKGQTKGKATPGRPFLDAVARYLLKTVFVVMELLNPRPAFWHRGFHMAENHVLV